ncbi:hypothetical protein PO472_05760 [Atlantibacter hermannii]|uniref:gp53-like domain-containing protein n=1 Tax=Atlantibacter hermannii TaxID=565 RepID=UPI002FF9F3AB
MSKIERYAGNLRAFGSNAQGLERTLFGETTQADDLTSQVTAAFLRGWGIVGPSENPSLEDFNAAMYAMSQFIAYQHQMGIPEWDATQEYYTGSLCVHDGETYSSLVDDNIGSIPPSAKWTPVLTTKNGRLNLGFDAMGIGLSGNILQSLSSLDWQTFEFVTGALYVVQSGNMTNVPVGLDVPGPTYNTLIRVNGPEGGNRHVEVVYSTTSSANYRFYQVRVSGLFGSRTFVVRKVLTSVDVGTGTNQIPDMSFFTLSMGQTGYQKLPSGMIIQWGIIALGNDGNAFATLPLTFPNSIHGGVAGEAAPTGWSANSCVVVAFDLAQSSRTGVTVRARSIVGTGGPTTSTATFSVRYFCWGY